MDGAESCRLAFRASRHRSYFPGSGRTAPARLPERPADAAAATGVARVRRAVRALLRDHALGGEWPGGPRRNGRTGSRHHPGRGDQRRLRVRPGVPSRTCGRTASGSASETSCRPTRRGDARDRRDGTGRRRRRPARPGGSRVSGSRNRELSRSPSRYFLAHGREHTRISRGG